MGSNHASLFVQISDIMKSIVVELKCMDCLYQTHKKSETLVMPEFEPKKRIELVEELYFQKKCPCCNNVIQFLHPLLYIDKEHAFILMIKAKKDFREEDNNICNQYKNMQKRYISNITNIAEKIRIFEDGLDDRVIEIVKAKVALRTQRIQQETIDIVYRDMDKTSDTIWFTRIQRGACDVVAVAMQTYRQIQSTLPIDTCTSFEEVNITWAITYM